MSESPVIRIVPCTIDDCSPLRFGSTPDNPGMLRGMMARMFRKTPTSLLARRKRMEGNP